MKDRLDQLYTDVRDLLRSYGYTAAILENGIENAANLLLSQGDRFMGGLLSEAADREKVLKGNLCETKQRASIQHCKLEDRN
jgi:hypothetical protein